MKPILEASQVDKSFLSHTKLIQALSNISLSVEKGDIFGIIGQSGAGKSTLLRCLCSLEKPSSGAVFFEGQDISSLDEKGIQKARRRLGMIFQHFYLLSSRTVEKNVALSLEIQGIAQKDQQTIIHRLLSLVGLLEKKDQYPAQLSGGEKQRVAIARALANNPKILFCDEATSALDPKTTQDILQLLKTLNQTLDLTIVLITHEMDVIKKICNKVAVLHQGKIVEQGSVLDVFGEPKHKLTQSLLQNSSHELPNNVWKRKENSILLKLYFKGEAATRPIISHLIRCYGIEVNILLGWIDTVQSSLMGTLTVEMQASQEILQQGFHYLQANDVRYEVLS